MSHSRISAAVVAVARLLPVLVLPMLAACASPAAQAGDPPPTQVTAAPVMSRPITEWNEFTGRLEAVHHVDIRPRVSGVVASVHFTEGAVVHKGDVLFEIDPRPFQAEVDRLRAELLRTQATLTRTAAERDRATRLSESNAISNEERDRRLAAAEEADAQVQAVRAALRASELNLEFTRVVAPISGRVGQAIVTEGNLVSNGPGVATLLTTLVSLDPIYASFEVDEPTFLAFRHSRPSHVRLALAGDDGFPREGQLDFVDNQLDAATGTMRVRAVFANRDGSLTPGLFVRLQMPGHDAGTGVLIRDEAVGTDLDKRFVYVVNTDHTIAYRPVTLGPIVDGLRVVRTGVRPDEVVVTRGLQRVRPGVKVVAALETMEDAR